MFDPTFFSSYHPGLLVASSSFVRRRGYREDLCDVSCHSEARIGSQYNVSVKMYLYIAKNVLVLYGSARFVLMLINYQIELM